MISVSIKSAFHILVINRNIGGTCISYRLKLENGLFSHRSSFLFDAPARSGLRGTLISRWNLSDKN